MSTVPRETREDVRTIMQFFGLQEDSVIHIFRRAADTNVDAFSITMRVMAEAVREDLRYGTTERIRRMIEQDRAARGRR